MIIRKENSKKNQKSLRIIYGLGVTVLSTILVLLYTWEYLESKWMIHHSMWKMPILAILGAIVVLDILIFVVIDIIRKYVIELLVKEKEVKAKLVSKTSYPYTIQKAMVSNGAGGRSTVDVSHALTGIRYELFFELQDEEVLNFLVSKQLFDTLHEGEEGSLQYRGEKFIGFLHVKRNDLHGDDNKGFVTMDDEFGK